MRRNSKLKLSQGLVHMCPLETQQLTNPLKIFGSKLLVFSFIQRLLQPNRLQRVCFRSCHSFDQQDFLMMVNMGSLLGPFFWTSQLFKLAGYISQGLIIQGLKSGSRNFKAYIFSLKRLAALHHSGFWSNLDQFSSKHKVNFFFKNSLK